MAINVWGSLARESILSTDLLWLPLVAKLLSCLVTWVWTWSSGWWCLSMVSWHQLVYYSTTGLLTWTSVLSLQPGSQTASTGYEVEPGATRPGQATPHHLVINNNIERERERERLNRVFPKYMNLSTYLSLIVPTFTCNLHITFEWQVWWGLFHECLSLHARAWQADTFPNYFMRNICTNYEKLAPASL